MKKVLEMDGHTAMGIHSIMDDDDDDKEYLLKERIASKSEFLTFSVHSPNGFLPFYVPFWLSGRTPPAYP